MSDHTPSVKYFREFYAVESDGAISLDEARAEFDRMIEAVRAEEREKAARIAETSYEDQERHRRPDQGAGKGAGIVSIREEAQQEAERRRPDIPADLPGTPGNEAQFPTGYSYASERSMFVAGAVWASEQAEGSDRMGPAAYCHLCAVAGGYPDHHGQWVECSCQRADREPSDAEVEAAARKVFETDAPSHEPEEWFTVSPQLRNDYRATARAALLAARGEVRDVS